MSTHDLGFRAKIRDNVYPCKPQFYYLRMGCEGVQITQVCYHDKQHDQGLDKFCPAGKFQWKKPDNAGMANTLKVTEVANTGT